MATFEVRVHRISVKPHPNADLLEIAKVRQFKVVVAKGQFKTGDLAVFIPEESVIPPDLQEELGLTDKLRGPDKNVVRAVKLRGELSQGLLYPNKGWQHGQEVSEILGIAKYEPEIPKKIISGFQRRQSFPCISYDIENIKYHPNAFHHGERVVVTEKIHGTWCQIGVCPNSQGYNNLVVSSKGLASKNIAFAPKPLTWYQRFVNLLCFKPADSRRFFTEEFENVDKNVYLRVARNLKIKERIETSLSRHLNRGMPVYILGEVFGAGVQDLDYGASIKSDASLGFRVFDIFIGWPGAGYFVGDNVLSAYCNILGLHRVPVLYTGPYTPLILSELTRGMEEVSGKSIHVREGVVVRSCVERNNSSYNRSQYKSISEDYLLRRSRKGEELTSYT